MRNRLLATTLCLATLASPSLRAADDAVTPAAPAAADSASPAASAARTAPRPDAFAYTLAIDAPSSLVPVLEDAVGLARWQNFGDMTQALFDALARQAIGEAEDAAAASGWFSAEVEVRVDPKPTPAMVTLVVTPGPPTQVRDVRVHVDGPAASDVPAGTDVVARLQGAFALSRGDVFSQAQWTRAKNDAVEALARAGFAAAKITASEASIDPAARSADLAVTLASGPRFRVGELRIRGLKRYTPDLVRNFGAPKAGDYYDAETLDTLVRRLNATGYFASVQAALVTRDAVDDVAPIDIAVIEAPTRTLDSGIGYSTDTRFRANASWRNVDIDGKATQLAVDAHLDETLSSFAVRITRAPNAAGWIDGVQGAIERTDISNLVTETAVTGVRRTSVDTHDNWAFGAAYYFDRQQPDGAPRVTSHALYTDVVRTWRRTDDPIAPTRGYNVELDAGVGIPGASTRGFGRTIVKFAAWHPLGRDITLSLRAEGGAVLAGSRDGIPSALLFRTGGDTTVRGYAFESLGVKSGDATVPGRYYAVASAEATKWFAPTWGIATFVDAGNAVDEPKDLSHLALGYGVGARLRTPIGPFRLDLAYGQDAHSVRVHFSVGLAF